MNKQEFTNRVNEICTYINSATVEDMRKELIARGAKNPFSYGSWCEANFEKNLREDYERKTTFTNDFSLAEYCVPMEGMSAISDTLKNALIEYKENIPYFAELIIVLNKKAWEHDARHNCCYSRMYSELYYMVKDLFFDWFEEHIKHDEAMQYYYDYID